MTKRELYAIAQSKASTLPAKCQILVHPEHNYWIFNYGNGIIYIGYFFTEPEENFFDKKPDYIMMAHGKEVAKVQQFCVTLIR